MSQRVELSTTTVDPLLRLAMVDVAQPATCDDVCDAMRVYAGRDGIAITEAQTTCRCATSRKCTRRTSPKT